MRIKYWALTITTIILVASGFLAANQLTPRKHADKTQITSLPPRASLIPGDAVKATPQTDAAQPKSLSLEYADPVPVPGKVNTAGA